MGEGRSGRMRPRAFAAWVLMIVGVAVLQSMVHLVVTLGERDFHSRFDLDRSNGAPDLVSTLALGCATAGAVALTRWERHPRRIASGCLAVVLGALTVADLLHDGAHPSSEVGRLVIALVTATAGLLVTVGLEAAGRTRATLAAAGIALACSFLVSGLDRFDIWFERMRGDPVAEYQIVAKEGLELVGWSLVALALWDESLRRRRRARLVARPEAVVSV